MPAHGREHVVLEDLQVGLVAVAPTAAALVATGGLVATGLGAGPVATPAATVAPAAAVLVVAVAALVLVVGPVVVGAVVVPVVVAPVAALVLLAVRVPVLVAAAVVVPVVVAPVAALVLLAVRVPVLVAAAVVGAGSRCALLPPWSCSPVRLAGSSLPALSSRCRSCCRSCRSCRRSCLSLLVVRFPGRRRGATAPPAPGSAGPGCSRWCGGGPSPDAPSAPSPVPSPGPVPWLPPGPSSSREAPLRAPPWAALMASIRSPLRIPVALMPSPPASCLSSGSSIAFRPLLRPPAAGAPEAVSVDSVMCGVLPLRRLGGWADSVSGVAVAVRPGERPGHRRVRNPVGR